MTRYALVIDGQFQRIEFSDSKPPDIAHKSVTFLPCPVVSKPSFNEATEVVEGPTYDVQQESVVETWTKRDKNATELDNDKESNLTKALCRVIVALALNHENRIRALEGKNAVTAAQLRSALKNLL